MMAFEVRRFRGVGPGWSPVDSKCNTIMLLHFDPFARASILIHSSSPVLGARDDVLDGSPGMARCASTDLYSPPALHCAETTSSRHGNTPGWKQEASERLI